MTALSILIIALIVCWVIFIRELIKIANSVETISKRKAKKIREILGDK